MHARHATAAARSREGESSAGDNHEIMTTINIEYCTV